jgi:hypothetical protein
VIRHGLNLAVRPGGKHKDLGEYKRQNFGCAFGLPKCPRCGKKLTRGAHPCFRNLPGVYNACCGHGVCPPYATLRNGFCLYAKPLQTYLEKMGRWEKWEGITKPKRKR